MNRANRRKSLRGGMWNPFTSKPPEAAPKARWFGSNKKEIINEGEFNQLKNVLKTLKEKFIVKMDGNLDDVINNLDDVINNLDDDDDDLKSKLDDDLKSKLDDLKSKLDDLKSKLDDDLDSKLDDLDSSFDKLDDMLKGKLDDDLKSKLDVLISQLHDLESLKNGLIILSKKNEYNLNSFKEWFKNFNKYLNDTNIDITDLNTLKKYT